jgi:hypothetical protein
MTSIDLARFVADFARAPRLADAKRPQSKRWSPGIGSFDESQAIRLIFQELADLEPATYSLADRPFETPYPGDATKRLDIRLGPPDAPTWAIEVKMMWLLRNNGDIEPSAVGHILSPYEVSALVDCEKLVSSSLPGRKAS